MTRITPNGRVKDPLMRPFGVIRVIRGYFFGYDRFFHLLNSRLYE